ncbi:MAG: polysaccharide pyruvyl transferase family protein [Muribaculaceae bacterium]|nr:polysaccharide pyruvyl transferase family protein [Muribaculaceae bacterium]
MKIGILTFHCATNYGAVLQTYGLKEVLCRMGHDVRVIDYRPGYLVDAYKTWQGRPGFKSLVKSYGWSLWIDFLINNYRKEIRNRKFELFVERHLSLDKKTLSKSIQEYDVIVCGSDQIWNPYITGYQLDNAFFGILPNASNAKLVSYAASVGHIVNLRGYEKVFVDKLKHLSSISVRENNLADYILSLNSGFSVDVVVDPTILAGINVFETLCAKRSLIKGSYLLYFDLFNDSRLRQTAKLIAKEKKLQFIELTTYHERVAGQKILAPASPNEFCTLFKYADYIICASFHGMVFSILFNRQFVVYANPERGLDRFVSFLNDVGLSDRLIKSYAQLENLQIVSKVVDYDTVNSQLMRMQNHSLNWLRKALV